MPIPSKAAPIDRLTARERIVHTLQTWIIDGTMKPGEKISDAELSKYFSVSRTPVREAMHLLAQQNLIEIIPGKESRVMPIDKEGIQQAYLLLSVLHATALELAFPKIGPKELKEMEKIQDGFRKSVDTGRLDQIREYDKAFHNYILKLAGNQYIIDFTDNLLIHIHRVENLNYTYRLDKVKSVEEHGKIIDALRQGDLTTAIVEMRTNWLHFGEDLDFLC